MLMNKVLTCICTCVCNSDIECVLPLRATWHTLTEMPAEIMNDDDSGGIGTPLDSVSVVSTPYSQESEEVIIEGRAETGCERAQ